MARLLCFVELSFSFLFFHDAKLKFERTTLFIIPHNTFFLSSSVINNNNNERTRHIIAALVVVRFDLL